jgi:hypothetical protein
MFISEDYTSVSHGQSLLCIALVRARKHFRNDSVGIINLSPEDFAEKIIET